MDRGGVKPLEQSDKLAPGIVPHVHGNIITQIKNKELPLEELFEVSNDFRSKQVCHLILECSKFTIPVKCPVDNITYTHAFPMFHRAYFL